jgi:hypothetical protein
MGVLIQPTPILWMLRSDRTATLSSPSRFAAFHSVVFDDLTTNFYILRRVFRPQAHAHGIPLDEKRRPVAADGIQIKQALIHASGKHRASQCQDVE